MTGPTLSDPGLRRVAVHAGTATVDLALPAGVPVAALIPSILDILGQRGCEETPTRYQLHGLGSPPLPSSSTLAQNGIRDGTVLVLSQSPPAPPTALCDDAAEAVAATLNSSAPAQARQATRLAGAVAAVCVTTVGAGVLIRNALPTNSATAAVAAASGIVALLSARIAHRAYRDPMAALALSLIAVIFAAVTGLLAVPGIPGPAHVLLAAMAASVAAVLAIRVTDCRALTLTALAWGAVVIAVVTLAGVFTAAPAHVIGALAALTSLSLLEVSPRISIMLAGLSPKDDDEKLPAADSLAIKAIRADAWLTSLLAGFSASAAIGASTAALTAHGAITATPLAAATGALLLLRARTADRTRALVFAISGILTLAVAFVITAVSAPQHGPWIALLTTILAAVSVYLGCAAPAMTLSPVARRGIEALECLTLVALVPLTCWICGAFRAFSTIRQLELP